MILLLLLSLTHEHIIVDEFDIIEVNERYNHEGGHLFDQVLFKDWNPCRKTFTIEAWRMMPNSRLKDPDEEKAYKKAIDEYLTQYPAEEQQKLRKWLRYPGQFVGGKLMPIYSPTTGYWYIKFIESRRKRYVRAKIFKHTRSMFDPEVRQKNLNHKRRGFTEPPSGIFSNE